MEEAVGRLAPADYGPGPGRPEPAGASAFAPAAAIAPIAASAATGAATIPPGGPEARTRGVFGQPVTWALNALQAAILPDGRVLTYGVREGGKLVYDVWDPTLGTDADSHLTLPNRTTTDIFCTGQSVLPTTGEVLLVGGSITIDGVTNNGVAATTYLGPDSGSMVSG